MGKKILSFMYGRLGIFVCIAILFPLLTAVTSSSQYLYVGNSTATVKVLVVAGGGGGGSGYGGGGGAGGYKYDASFTVIPQAYTVTVGSGGVPDTAGGDSIFSTITATGGGGGNGGNGGSGAGGYASSAGGSGTSGQGNNGGSGGVSSGGGGGGASNVGGNGKDGAGGAGGDGTANSISGSSVTYAGGGGGSSIEWAGGGAGGAGGGGHGSNLDTGNGGSGGQANTGGGGGGRKGSGGYEGGSGVVIISYVTADFGDCTGGTETIDGVNTVHTFTSSGTFTVALPAATPTVMTSSATNVTSNSATLNGTVNANGTSTTTWFNYGIASGTYTGTSTTQSVSGSSNTTVGIGISGLSSSTTYYYRIAATNSGGTVYGSEASFTTGSTPTPTDTTAPSGSVSINSGDSYTSSTAVTLTLSATDSVGVVGYYVSTSSSTPVASASGWNSVTSTTSYTGSVSYSLASGDENKTVYVWYKDAAGNVSSTASDSIILDTTAPIVTITSPTLSDTYTTTSSPLSLSGSASDSSSGVKEVTWSSDKGGSGTASGTTYWSISSISLTSGENKITVTAKDNVGNTSTDTITVAYTASTAPTVETGSAINVTINSATLSGTVNANGLSTTAWFEYGTVKGSYGNKSSTQTVTGSTDTTVSITITGLTAETTYYYRIAAQNNSGTSYGEEMSFYKSDRGNAPTVETEAATDITNTTAKLNGKCNPNGQSTTAWFEYGTLSGTYNYQTSTQSVSGSSYTNISATITGLNVGTKYYYRIVAKNSVGTSYGTEMEFYKSPGTGTTPTPTATPTPTTSPAPTLSPLPTPQVSPSPSGEGIVFGFVNDEDELPLKGVTITITGKNSSDSTETDENGYYEFSGLVNGDYTLTYEKEGFLDQTQDISLEEGELKDLGTVTMEQAVSGKIYGYVVNIKGDPIEFVRLKLRGIKTKVTKNASTDADGFFEFADLEADTYVIVAKKKKYRNTQQKITLEEGASEEIEIVMKKTSKRIKGLLLEEDVQ